MFDDWTWFWTFAGWKGFDGEVWQDSGQTGLDMQDCVKIEEFWFWIWIWGGSDGFCEHL